MQLSREQFEAAKGGATVRLKAEDTELVVLRADLFERVMRTSYDDGDWTEEEMRALAASTFDDADTAGPIP
ncbi:MAG: hypothetical protein KY475_18935 [Planctomycetes bacterium]|nr:hypothetical protein [Planctomycetota bacterium]